MADKLGVGIIGCGNISTTYLRLAPLFRGLEVRACADVVLAAAEKRGEEFGVEAQSVDALLANDAVDVVINLTGRSVNCRYNAVNRRDILQSRIASTRAIGEAIGRASRPPHVWLQASTA